jgi:ABC-2 type transport system ATP-binding protein
MNVIDIKNISYAVDEQDILQDVDMQVGQGKVVALLGHNGSGKSTLIDIITGTLKPTTGSASVFGDSFQQVKQRVGVLYEAVPLFPLLKVEEIIRYIAAIYGVPFDAVLPAIQQLELTEVLSRQFRVLSQGQRKKVGLILSTMHRPELLILDEPTSVLDPFVREQCWRLIRQYQPTVLLTTHIWEEAVQFADEVVFIHQGRVLNEAASPQTLLSEQYLPGEAKVVAPRSPALLEKLQGQFPHYSDEEQIHIYTETPDAAIALVRSVTFGFSVVPKSLKDIYQFLASKTQSSCNELFESRFYQPTTS